MLALVSRGGLETGGIRVARDSGVKEGSDRLVLAAGQNTVQGSIQQSYRTFSLVSFQVRAGSNVYSGIQFLVIHAHHGLQGIHVLLKARSVPEDVSKPRSIWSLVSFCRVPSSR